MARGASSRAASEFSSVRARAYPGIWAQKTQAAIDKNIRRDGEAFPEEAFYAKMAVKVTEKILKEELPGHRFDWSQVEANDRGTFDVIAQFTSPNGVKDERILGSLPTSEKAEAISQQLSEGMDLRENGRPLNLRRMKPDEEAEENKDLDALEKRRRQEREEKVADKRRSERNYQAFVKNVKDKMEAERKARANQ
jgi:hypothetical protein